MVERSVSLTVSSSVYEYGLRLPVAKRKQIEVKTVTAVRTVVAILSTVESNAYLFFGASSGSFTIYGSSSLAEMQHTYFSVRKRFFLPFV